MSSEARYVMSPDVILESIDSSRGDRTLVNTVTGHCLRVSSETMKLLKAFKTPTSSRRAAQRLRLKKDSDILELRRRIAALAESYFLLDANQPYRKAETASFRRAIDKDCFIQTSKAYANCEKVRLDDLLPGDVVIAGVPIDFATSGRPGSRYGPDRLRDVSLEFVKSERDPFTGRNRGWYNADIDRTILRGIRLVDVGNIFARPSEGAEDVFARCYNGALVIYRRECFPVFIGGDHSISAPLIKAACDSRGPLTVIHLDAHTDRAEWDEAGSHHHGNVMTRVLRENSSVKIFQYGLRGFIGEASPDSRCQMVPQRRIEDNLRYVLSREIPRGRQCYLSIDVDVLDPSIAPATGTPVPMGMQPRAMLKLIDAIAQRNTIVGLDFVELSPDSDRDGRTTSLVFHLLSAIMGLTCDRRKTVVGAGQLRSGRQQPST